LSVQPNGLDSADACSGTSMNWMPPLGAEPPFLTAARRVTTASKEARMQKREESAGLRSTMTDDESGAGARAKGDLPTATLSLN